MAANKQGEKRKKNKMSQKVFLNMIFVVEYHILFCQARIYNIYPNMTFVFVSILCSLKHSTWICFAI